MIAFPPQLNAASESHLDGDHTLVQCYRSGDASAVEELYRRYADRLKRLVAGRCTSEFASRFDAEDIVQSVFRAFCEGVRCRFYDVPQGGELWGLLFVLAVNKVRDQVAFHRAERRSVHRTRPADSNQYEPPSVEDETTATQLRLTVEDYLASLEETERQIVSLRMAGYSVAEVAEMSGRARRTVERILQHTRDQLTDLLRP